VLLSFLQEENNIATTIPANNNRLKATMEKYFILLKPNGFYSADGKGNVLPLLN
jgi:hypothetical protein